MLSKKKKRKWRRHRDNLIYGVAILAAILLACGISMSTYWTVDFKFLLIALEISILLAALVYIAKKL